MASNGKIGILSGNGASRGCVSGDGPGGVRAQDVVDGRQDKTYVQLQGNGTMTTPVHMHIHVIGKFYLPTILMMLQSSTNPT